MSVLKLLFDKFPNVDVSVLEDHLQQASQGPFYQPEYDIESGQGTVYRGESTTSGWYIKFPVSTSEHNFFLYCGGHKSNQN